MNIRKIKLIYFSPTGTTRKVLESIANGFNAERVESFDLTRPDYDKTAIVARGDELVLLGVPVYGGRVPVEAVNRFKKLGAEKSPAVSVVVYGNREFEDSLRELHDLASALGCCPVAGGAFIGEHSFSTDDTPIAAGRPDRLDLEKAASFGATIRIRLNEAASAEDLCDLQLPGRFPYEGGARALTIAPLTNTETCTRCGTCAEVCPTGAVTVNESVTTVIEQCIRCCACIKSCPEGARYWDDPTMAKITAWLIEHCTTRKEPQIFMANKN